MSKKLMSLLLTCCMLFYLSACSTTDTSNKQYESTQTELDNNVDDIVSLVEITSTGQIPYNKFKDCGGYNELYSNVDNLNYFDTELFPFSHKSKYGYADASGNIVISERYDDAIYFSENKAFVKQNNRWKVIDINGNELLTIPEGYDASYSYFREGFCIIRGEFGYYGSKDELNVLVLKEDMTYTQLEIYEELTYVDFKVVYTPEFVGFLIYNCYVPERKFTLYDVTGKVVWTVTQKDESNINKFIVKNGYVNVLNEYGEWGLLNLKNGKVAIDYQYDYIGGYSDGVCTINQYGKWGCIDINGNIVVQPAFTFIGSFSNGRALAMTSDDQWVVIDKSGNVMSEFDISAVGFKYSLEFSKVNGIATFFNGKKYKFPIDIVTNEGKILLSVSDCTELYISNNYIFINDRMYRISR